MARLKFEMFTTNDPEKERGLHTTFTDGAGRSSRTWWSSPPDSIDHVDRGYLRGRFGSLVKTDRHETFIKEQFKAQKQLFEEIKDNHYRKREETLSLKHKDDRKWTHSTVEDIFRNYEYFDTKEEAIAAGKEEYDGTFYVGQVYSVDAYISVSADRVLEDVSQDLYEEVGEVGEDYLRHVKKEDSDELQKQLTAVTKKWMQEKGYEPNFFKVDNVITVEGVTTDGSNNQ